MDNSAFAASTPLFFLDELRIFACRLFKQLSTPFAIGNEYFKDKSSNEFDILEEMKSKCGVCPLIIQPSANAELYFFDSNLIFIN